MTIDDQIKDEKLQYDSNSEAAKISALSSGKIDKCEYFKDEEILSPNQKQIVEQAKFTYSPLGKIFKKPAKTIQDQGKKQVDTLKNLKLKDQIKSIEEIFLEDHQSDEIKNEFHKTKKYENRVIKDNLFYESSKQVYDFKVFRTRSFGDSIYNHKFEIHEANQEQADLLKYILSFNNKTMRKSCKDKNKKNDIFDSARNLYEDRNLVLNAFKSGLFALKLIKGTELKILTLKY